MNRRNFVKLAIGAAVAAAVLPDAVMRAQTRPRGPFLSGAVIRNDGKHNLGIKLIDGTVIDVPPGMIADCEMADNLFTGVTLTWPIPN